MTAPERIWATSVTENYGEWQTTTDGLPRPTEYVRADLYAALEAQLAERVKVKPLEWRGTEGIWAKADALFGATYRITEYAGMAKPFKLETVGFVGPNGHYGTLDEAKAAAQADYESRILSPLEATPPAPKVTEAMVEAASREYMRIFDKHLLSEHARLILIAAQEAGKPSTPEGQQCRCDKCNAVIELDVHVPDEIWKRISPKPIDGYKGGGLLCPQCIVDALKAAMEAGG